jgi:galactokinase/mevalonate kinase-like predicted kinase
MHEMPGITPQVATFATRLADRGFSVAMPHLFGDVGRPLSVGYIAGQFARACVRREFALFAANKSSPLTQWLRALCKALHAEITTPHIERIEETARAAGAIGFKINGAGGGGSLTILTEANRRRDVEEAVKQAGYQLLPCRFDWDGLRTWVSRR